ncbi:MAG: hypothetical protein H6684_13830 [Deltaproteobacteria bacterium]|nr:hypothetical protein [Deltaproteobacteria bacterium]
MGYLRALTAILFLATAVLVGGTACEDDGTGAVGPSPVRTGGQITAPVHSKFDMTSDAGFFDAPAPSVQMRAADGSIRDDLYPEPDTNALVQDYLDAADASTDGFPIAAAVYLPFEDAINSTRLPATPADSQSESATAYLVNVDSASARYGERLAVDVVWQAAATDTTPANLLTLTPAAGSSMEAGAIYAAVVLSEVGGADDRGLSPSLNLATMRDGGVPTGAYGEVNAEIFENLWAYAEDFGVDADGIAAATVFPTAP